MYVSPVVFWGVPRDRRRRPRCTESDRSEERRTPYNGEYFSKKYSFLEKYSPPNKSKKARTKSQNKSEKKFERIIQNGAITSPFGPIINFTNVKIVQ